MTGDIHDLEPLICDALQMASITRRLSELTVGARAHEMKGNVKTFHFTSEQVENLTFAIIKTGSMIADIKAKWEDLI